MDKHVARYDPTCRLLLRPVIPRHDLQWSTLSEDKTSMQAGCLAKQTAQTSAGLLCDHPPNLGRCEHFDTLLEHLLDQRQFEDWLPTRLLLAPGNNHLNGRVPT